jgi:predicted nucleic acid-binding Zn ribbon protein
MFHKLDSSIFSQALSRAGIGKQVAAAHVVSMAEEVLQERFGGGIERFARPRSVRNRQLVIDIHHPAVGEELRRQEEAVIGAINEKIGRPELVRIIFQIPRPDGPQPE